MPRSFRPLSRRHLLRGAGAALALPALELMGASAAPPTRFVCLFQPNGVFPAAWDLPGPTLDGDLSPILRPLAPHREQLTVLRQLDNTGFGHVALTTAFLTGVGVKDRRNAVSLDQWIARKIGEKTVLPSLELGTEPPRPGGDGGQPIAYANTIAWNSPSTRLSPEIIPQAAFDRLFRTRTDPASRRAAEQRLSVIDLVLDEAKSLRRQAGSADQARLDEYLESVRTVERQLERSLEPAAGEVPAGVDLVRPPSGIPGDRRQHLRLMMDVLVLALRTDSTRVATLMTAHGFSRQSFAFLGGITTDHHGMSHHRQQPVLVAEYTRVCTWFMEQFAYLLDRMSVASEAGGTLLDHSLVLYGCGMKDGNGHVPRDLPLLLAGKAGGALRPGKIHTAPPGTPLAHLHLAIAQQFGIAMNDFNGTGAKPLSGLFT
ncbi:MAG: DUF1552 domain-containing protein [Verrucomicrobia bacterium]|nr:DUF1552 domain-containing protein [Verrucomicrobiota bacterium]